MKRTILLSVVAIASTVFGQKLEITSPTAGATVGLMNENHRAFLAMNFDARVAYMTNAACRKAMNKAGDRPLAAELVWQGGEGEFAVRVVRTCDGKTVYEGTTNERKLKVKNLEIAREYEWSVRTKDENVSSRFTTEALAPRVLDVKGVPNMRDFGGWIGFDGRRVRQGVIYRSAGWNNNAKHTMVTNADGKVERVYEKKAGKRRIDDATEKLVRETFGIKTDLDVRGKNEIADMCSSPVGADVTWTNLPSSCYGSMKHTWAKRAFAADFRVLADKRNHPVVFHCIAGADRTGCLAFAMNGLLGVPFDDLVKDWQMTGFAGSAMEFNYENYLKKFIDILNTYPGQNICEKLEAFARECGITDGEIAAWRELMLEGGK